MLRIFLLLRPISMVKQDEEDISTEVAKNMLILVEVMGGGLHQVKERES